MGRPELREHTHAFNDVERGAAHIDGIAAAANGFARSTTVTSKPYRSSQYARAGPAMLAPEIKTHWPRVLDALEFIVMVPCLP